MPYRHRDSMSRKLRAARAARERKRLEGPEPSYPRALPALRRTLIIIDYDFGKVEHRIGPYRTPRVDCYRAVADGVEWKRRIGWSKVLAGLRVKFPAYALLDFPCQGFPDRDYSFGSGQGNPSLTGP